MRINRDLLRALHGTICLRLIPARAKTKRKRQKKQLCNQGTMRVKSPRSSEHYREREMNLSERLFSQQSERINQPFAPLAVERLPRCNAVIKKRCDTR